MAKLENTIADHKRESVPGLALQNFREKEAYLQFEVCPFSFSNVSHINKSFLAAETL